MKATTSFVGKFPQVNGAPVELGQYQPTALDHVKAKAQMTIESCNGGSYTISTKGIEISGRGVKERHDNGCYEVTAAKLAQLQKSFDVVPNF